MASSDVSYCINPFCQQRESDGQAENCASCGLSLTVNGQYRLLSPITDLDKPRPTEVFEGRDKKGEHTIIKILRREEPSYFKLFEREAAVLRQLRHSGIPRVYASDLFTVKLPDGQDLYAFAMKKIEGSNLEDYLSRHQPISPTDAVDWLKQIVEILHYIHREGFIHRDIKPSNIILRPNGKIALIDFGGVRSTSTQTYLAKVSSSYITKLGSNGYTPHEQWHGQALPQSDFYALGRTMICLLTGLKPFELSVNEQDGKLIWRDLAPKAGVKLTQLLDQMTAFAPGKRPKNTEELLTLIHELSSAKTLPRPKRWMLAVGLVVTGLSFGGYSLSRDIRANYHYANALIERDEGNLIQAKASLVASIKIKPTGMAYQRLAAVCRESQDNACAIETYKQAIQRYPNRWEMYFDFGDFYERLSKPTEAEKLYRTAIEISPSEAVDAYNNLARLQILQNKLDVAVDLLMTAKNLPADVPLQSVLNKNLGWAFYLQGQHSRAEEALRQSLSLDDSNTAAHCLTARVQEELGRDAGVQWRRCTTMTAELPEVLQWQEEYITSLQK